MNALQVTNLSNVSIEIVPLAHQKRDALVGKAKDITAIDDSLDYESAVECLREIKALKSDVEKSRTQVKAPVLDVGRTIDAKAKEFIAPIDPEEKRITGLVLDHERKLREIREAEERKRQEELRKIEQARLEAERQARAKAEAEAAAALNEQERKAAAARAEAEQKRLAEQTAQASKQVTLAFAPQESRPQGVKAKQEWTFEVTDVAKLYQARPELVELTVKTLATKNAVNAGLRECPGLRIFQKDVVRL